MIDKCETCPIRVNCDFLSGMCRLSAAEVARRPELIFSVAVDKQKQRRIRRQKREHNARVRARRRAEIPALRLAFSQMLTEYGTFGKHSELMRMVRAMRLERARA